MTRLRRIFTLTLVTVLLAGCNAQIFGAQTATPAAYQTRVPVPTAAVTVLPNEDRPNIILILVDDLDSKLGTLEYMPHLQELMIEQGLVFKDFFVSDPTCCPSRATILRGEYTHNHEIYTSSAVDGFQRFYELDHDSSTIATWLQAAGYRTMYLGKYLNGYPIPVDRTHVPQGWDEWYSPARGKPYTGFDFTLNINGTLVPRGSHPDDYLMDVLSLQAEEFLRAAGQDDAPFFMFMAPYQPHEPAMPAPRHADLFTDLQAPRGGSFNETDVLDKPDYIKYDPLLTAEQIEDIDFLYRRRLQSMQSVDEMIARLFNSLEETGQLDETYIIFTSDNGYHLGQHRLVAGKSTAYEEDINVPFVIFGPHIPSNKIVDGYLVGNVDIAPTIAELAGVMPNHVMDGRSLVPLLTEQSLQTIEWRQAYLIEYYFGSETEGNSVQLVALGDPAGILEPADLGDRSQQPPSISYRGLRTKEYLYVEYTGGFIELYDLLQDPLQLENIASLAEPALLAEFSAWLKDLSTCRGDSCVSIESR
jgi:N-acetylglucosamine-6-sulfatase